MTPVLSFFFFINDDSDKKYALKNHNHDSVYAAKSHTHDDRYYTETEINNKISTLQTSFQDGVDTLYNKCTGLGFTPAGKSPSHISNTIQKIYDDRYNAGRTQGQNDVKNNPGAYGINISSFEYGGDLSKFRIGHLGNNETLDLKIIRPSDYTRLRTSNFLIVSNGASVGGPLGQNNDANFGISISYNPSNGILSCSTNRNGDYISFNMSGDIYLFAP